MISWNDFLKTIALIATTSITHSIWVDKIKKRVGEMGRIMDRIEELNNSGELWKYHQDIPVKRVDFLKKESYAYTFVGFFILIVIGFGIYEVIELISSNWFSSMDKVSSEAYSGKYRIRASGYILIGLLRIFPLYASFIFVTSGYSTIVWLRSVLPTFIRYVRKDLGG